MRLVAVVVVGVALGCGGAAQDAAEAGSPPVVVAGQQASGGARGGGAPAHAGDAVVAGQEPTDGGSSQRGGAGGTAAGGSGSWTATGGSASAGSAPHHGGASGSAGSSAMGGDGGAADSPDPCATPDGSYVADCDGRCGAKSSCEHCQAFGTIASGAYVVLDSNGPTCGACDWIGVRVPVAQLTCVKVTVQDGASARMVEVTESCSDPGTTSGCIVVSSTSGERYVSVARPDTAAWFLYETAPLEFNKCPLSCP